MSAKYAMRWGPKGFLVSSDKIVPIEQFTTSFKLKKDTNDAAGSASASNTRGRDLQPIAVTTHYYRALGTEPREQIEEWASLIGAYHPLYLGEKRFGPAYVQLQGVSVTDTQTDNLGNMLYCAISLSFEEYIVPDAPKKPATTPANDIVAVAPAVGEYKITHLTEEQIAEIQSTPEDTARIAAKMVSLWVDPKSQGVSNTTKTAYSGVLGLTASTTDKAAKNPHTSNQQKTRSGRS